MWQATGEGPDQIEGQGPYLYQGEMYILLAKVHIYRLSTMTARHWSDGR